MTNTENFAAVMQNEIVKANYLEAVQKVMDQSFGSGGGEAIAKNMRIVDNCVYIEAELSFPVPNGPKSE